MEHEFWIAIISGLTATVVPTVGVLIAWSMEYPSGFACSPLVKKYTA